MTDGDIPERVRHFIFEQIDSAEQLEVLLFLRQNSEKSWTSADISSQLRSTLISVNSRLDVLERQKLIEKSGEVYRYHPQNEELKATIDQINDIYKLRRQKILELIFSPMKKARHFADAFMVHKPTKKGD